MEAVVGINHILPCQQWIKVESSPSVGLLSWLYASFKLLPSSPRISSRSKVKSLEAWERVFCALVNRDGFKLISQARISFFKGGTKHE